MARSRKPNERVLRVSEEDLRLTRAVRQGIRGISLTDLGAYLATNPNGTVHDVCRDLLGGLAIKSTGGTSRAYMAVYHRLRRARKRLGLT